ncbi:ABC transporter permease [Marivibrio halodurans]|uniref:ABC transporter permease n=2 Tax=Marivibrio halodurans TaxID=2039722 RepID=A0A8J7V3T3_9PROT|nr:ABC transporter permease [Marivibrio halodurans]
MTGGGLIRPLTLTVGLLALWQAAVWVSGAPPYILPGPIAVIEVLVQKYPTLVRHGAITASEILMGLALGTVFGVLSALVLTAFRPARRWLMPVLVVSQALPVFALAPMLTLWLGYGMASKVAMAVLIIYFPVTSAFHDGLKRTDPGWLDLARTMGGGRMAVLRRLRLPAALPAFASGLRVAAAVAPIGAVVGEWVGSSAGLGYLMLHANARLQISTMFAALLVLAVFSLTLFFVVDRGMRHLVRWQPEA